MANKNDFLVMEGDEENEDTKVSAEESVQQDLPQHEPVSSTGFSESYYKSDVRNVLDLPSNGKLNYPATVEFRDMVYGDEKTLSGTDESNYTKTINSVMKSVMNDPEWYDDITITDRDYFFLMMFASNYSSDVDLDLNCKSCGHEFKTSVDLTELDVMELSDNYVEPFKIPLKSGYTAFVRLPRVKDELKVEGLMKRINKDGTQFDNNDVIMGLTTEIEMEDGNKLTLPLDQKIKWMFENLSVKDVNNIRKFYSYFNYGVDQSTYIKCPECGEENLYTVPFRIDNIVEKALSDDFEGMLQFNQASKDSTK